ncbi:MAG: divergent PAP2 family protein [Candidatus Woesearchaeota archaeon]
MLTFFSELIKNKIIIAVIFSYILTSILKIFFNFIKTKRIDLKLFFKTGGMPSSHSSSVSAMTSMIYFLEGMSNLFIVCFIISFIVFSDALGIRKAAGKHAEIINKLVNFYFITKKNKSQKKEKEIPERLYELLGHTPLQVAVGIILGIIVSYIVYLNL